MNKKSLIVIAVFSLALATLALPNAEAQLRDPTSLSLSPSSFTVKSGESITFTATLTSNGNPLADKNIEFGATNGSVDPNIGTTDSDGEVSVTYYAPEISARTSVTVTAHFVQTLNYKSSSASSSGTIKLRLPTSLTLSPSSFTVASENSISFTATLTSEGSPLSDKNIGFITTNGSLNKNVASTNSEGKASVIYSAPKVSVRTSTKVTAVFKGDVDYKASKDSSFGTIERKWKKISIQGAAFAIPETLKDDISGYKGRISDKVKDMLKVPIPDTGFLLANEDNVLLVLSTKSDKGLADAEGWVLPKSIDVKGISLNIMVAKTVSFDKEGSPVSVDEVLSNPDKYRLDLVKVNATRRQVSILYDPDEDTDIEFPVTSGYLVENPETVKTFLRKAIEKGKKIIRENGKPSIVKEVLQTEKACLPFFDLETDYWVNSPAATNGIVLPSGSRVINILKKLIPALNRNLQLDTDMPVLYDVKTNLDYVKVPSVERIKENPEQFRGKVIGFTAKGFEAGISVQETWRKLPPCNDSIEGPIPTPEGPVCIPILLDVRLEGIATWNKISVPPKRTDFLFTAGASSIHQDSIYETNKGKFKFIGRILSTKRIDNSLPERLALVIYDKRKIGGINYKQLAESVKEKIENNISTANWTLTGFSENFIPQVPSKPPRHLLFPGRPVIVKNPNKLPKIVRMAENLTLKVKVAGPENPIDVELENSKLGHIRANFSKVVKNLKAVVEKLKEKPPTVPEPPGLVHAYTRITINKPEASVENAGITFWVPKEWLNTHDIPEENVLLLRYHEGAWENLPTNPIGENGTHFKYRAKTPGFSTFAITAKVKAGVARFSMKNLSIGKKTLKPGESTAVSVKVSNTGGAEGSKTVKLEIEGDVADKETVTLSPGESKTVEFPISKEKEGTYEVTVGEMSKSFKVVKAVKKAEFEVSNINLSKEEVKKGETATVSVKVTNTGGKKGTYTAELSINDQVKTQSVALKPDESEEVTFEISREKTGTYEIKIGELSKTLNVKQPEKAGKGLPWALIGGIIVAVVAISAFALYKRE